MASIFSLCQKLYQVHQNRYFCTKYFTEPVLNHVLYNLTRPNLILPSLHYNLWAYQLHMPKTLTATYNLQRYKSIWCLATIAVTLSYHYLVQTYRFWDVKILLPTRENSVIESFHGNLEKNPNGAQISAKFGKLPPGPSDGDGDKGLGTRMPTW